MGNIKLNNSSSTQIKTFLYHYKINFQGLNTDPSKALTTPTQATVAQTFLNAYFL